MRKRIVKRTIAALASVGALSLLAGCAAEGDAAKETTVNESTTESTETVSLTSESASEASEASQSESASKEDQSVESSDSAQSGETEEGEETQDNESQAETSDDSNADAAESSSPTGLSPIEDSKVASDDIEIDIKGYKVVPAGVEGAQNSLNPVIVFYYDVTNLSDKDMDANTAWTEIFDAYQNSGENDRNMLGTGIYADSEIPAQDGTALIKKGETASYYKPYELTDDTTSVTLRSHDGLGGSELGEDIIVRVMS